MVSATTTTLQPEFLVGDLVGNLFQHLAASQQHGSGCARSAKAAGNQERTLIPDLDLYESKEAVLIELALPGVAKDSISIEYDTKTHRVVVSAQAAESKHAADGSEGGFKALRRERPTGKFERSIGLNQQVILADSISARYEDGVLQITVPKDPKADMKHKVTIA